MAFKPTTRPSVRYASPENLFNDSKRRKYAGLLSHQADVLRSYQSDALNRPDVAFQLPTGSGKTLVGVLLAEWRRRTFQERPLYLTPTRQLAFQVANEASQNYDIRVIPLVGKKSDFPTADINAWEAGDAIVVTTYNALFNVSPAFRDPSFIIVDDAHAAENYIASYWSLQIRKEDHPVLWTALAALLRDHLRPVDHQRLLERPRWPDDYAWVEKLPTPTLHELHGPLTAVLDAHIAARTEQWFTWGVIRSHLLACQLYLSPNEILLRPLIPPTSTHAPFSEANQRIYMSATLGQGGDLERLTGRREIFRIPVPKAWETQGIGRRLFLFPARSLDTEKEQALIPELVRTSTRCAVLTPTTRRADQLADAIAQSTGFRTFKASVIEQSKAPFVETTNAAAVLANRYDGIDFPGDECRLLIVDGMTRAVNLQERFFMSRMGAAVLLNDRMMTRIVQAFGRCTRSATDYAAVIVLGQEVLNLLTRREKRALLHPEIQAELEFGLDQSKDAVESDFLSMLVAFLSQTDEWQSDGETAIQSLRQETQQRPHDGADELSAGVRAEVDYQHHMWRGDYEGAGDAARRVLLALRKDSLRGYRGLWSYLAGSAAHLATVVDGRNLSKQSKDLYWSASREVSGLTWLKQLSRYADTRESGQDESLRDEAVFDRLEVSIEDIGTSSDRKLVGIEKDIRSGIGQETSRPFEIAHEQLGRLIGYQCGRSDANGAPDTWWIVDASLCLVFEDHSNATSATLAVEKARQAAGHPKWIRENLKLDSDAEIVPVLVSPVTAADASALPHLDGVCLWALKDFRLWIERALRAYREARQLYPGSPGDMVWRAEARAAFVREEVDLASLLEHLKKRNAKKVLGST